MAPTAPAASSPATAPATSCSRRSIAPASPTRPSRSTAATVSSSRAPGSRRWCVARRRPTGRAGQRSRSAAASSSASSRCSTGVRVVLALGAIGWRGFLDLARERGELAGPLPRFGHGAEAEIGRLRLFGCLSPVPAEHFHRPVDAGNARRRAGAGARARLTGPPRRSAALAVAIDSRPPWRRTSSS